MRILVITCQLRDLCDLRPLASGLKFSMVVNSLSPPPGTYKIPSDFDPVRKGNAFSFRCSWKSYSKVYQKEGFKNNKGADPNVPGPGTYKNLPAFGSGCKTASLKGKLKELPNHCQTPGPGAYKELSTLPTNGKNFYSKYKSINVGSIGPSSGSRFVNPDSKKVVPGPGQYNPKTELAKTGQYFLSKFKSSGTASLYKSARETMKLPSSDKFGPGPGSYLLPSDFGYPTLNKVLNTKRRKMARSSSQL